LYLSIIKTTEHDTKSVDTANSCLSWNKKRFIHGHKSRKINLIPSQMNLAQNLSPFSYYPPPTPKPSTWFFCMRYSHINLIRTTFISVHAPCPLHLILIVLTISVIFGEVYNSLGRSDFLPTLIASSNVSPNNPES
jgi:hypothetical protein